MMRRIDTAKEPPMRAILSCALLLVTLPAWANEPGCTTIDVTQVRPAQGRIMLAVYDSAADFNRDSVAAFQQRALGPVQRFSLCGLNGKAVALAAFQDLNGNGKLDRNLLGIPSEPWSASGTPPAMSAPTWDSGKVVLDGKPLSLALPN